jgi:hypothetical protein
VAVWSYATPFLLFGLMLVVLGPALVAVRITEWTFSTEVLALEIIVVSASMLLTSAGLWWAFAQGGLVARLRLGRFDPFVRASIVAFFAVASFGGLTGLLYLENALQIEGERIREEVIIDEASEFYIWHAVDTVPLLDIPENFQWEKPFEVEDRLGGLLLVVFTGIVILPLIQVVRLIAAGERQPYEEAILKALRRNLRGWKVHRTRGEHGADRAVVEKEVRILVDVMQGVWTEDAPLRRLRVVPAFRLTHQVDGYVLVVDVVGERARDRIEAAFSQSELPARLAVWRSDQPAVHLAQVVEEVKEDITSDA